MNVTEAKAFLEETKKYGSVLGLESIRRLMALLDNVQDKVPVVHIAGTNGKGSVGAMLSACLVEAGYRVGRFNTPDVFAYEEEFLLNGQPIRPERLAELFTKVAEACRIMTERGEAHPTRFEVETAAAFLWFYEEQMDIALVEVGMGGATDATNVIAHPLVSVITSISLDHMGFLGNTLGEIASVKAGTIKEGVPVVTVKQPPEAAGVIAGQAEKFQAPLYVAEVPDISGPGIRVADKTVTLSLKGTYQRQNAGCVLKVLELLRQSYPRLTEDAICHGLSHTVWPGRFECIGRNPLMILDGAHNEGAVRCLRESLAEQYPDRRILYIMGVLADKSYDIMTEIMFQPGDKVYTVTPPNSRALPAVELARLLKCRNICAVPCENVKDGVLLALREANPEDVILAFGSLYCLKEIRDGYELYKSDTEASGVSPDK